MTGTLIVFAILWILLDKLPESGGSTLVNDTLSTASCDVSPLNSDDAMAFWVRCYYS